jgi:integrase/recombinase XerD
MKIELLQKYQNYLLLEKSLSKNTVSAYLRDLNKLLVFLETKNILYPSASFDDLTEFLSTLHKKSISARSQARIVSGIRCFYGYLFLEDEITKDPTDLLETPKIGLKLPQVLSVNEINSIIAAIDLSLPQGQRNKAIIETLYSCGLRVF